jgi:SAM-dependent methyltransferase
VSHPKLSIGERLLLRLARDPSKPEIGATQNYTLDNCLDFARRTIEGFDDLVRGRTVLDYGCGPGFQSVAMGKTCGVKFVFGLDVVDSWISIARERAIQAGCEQHVQFGTQVPQNLEGSFDVVLSLSAFEHYKDPAFELEQMRRYLKPGGMILLAFAEPWYSHSGSHFNNYTNIPVLNRPVPWLNLLFSDRAMLALRSRFREDHPDRIEDISGGLNRMTIARFEQIISASGLKVARLRLFATLGLPLVTKLPVLRELLTSAASCILYNQNDG